LLKKSFFTGTVVCVLNTQYISAHTPAELTARIAEGNDHNILKLKRKIRGGQAEASPGGKK